MRVVLAAAEAQPWLPWPRKYVPQPRRPSDDPAGGTLAAASAALLLLPVLLGSVAALASYLMGK